MTKLQFKYNDFIEIPQELIDDAPKQGRFDDYADYLLNSCGIDFSVSDTDAIEYLDMVGAWDEQELQAMSNRDLLQKLLWIAILYCKENNCNEWHMGC